MAKIRDYECEGVGCDYIREEYFNDTEGIPQYLAGEKCPECGKRLRLRFSGKANGQRWRYNDQKEPEFS